MPSIPGFTSFPPFNIIQTVFVVAATGIEAKTIQSQYGSVSDGTTFIQASGIETSTKQFQSGGINIVDVIKAFGDVSQPTTVINPSFIEESREENIIVFPNTFERGTFILGAIGTSGTVQKFFDRSPFFFTPSELDPNTIRDISEAQQFLIFNQTSISSFDNFRNTIGTTTLITDHGDEVSSSQEKTNLITNGSFEQGISGFTISGTLSGDILDSRTDQPSGVGFDDSNPVIPIDGDRMLYVARRTLGSPITLTQVRHFGSKLINSSQLGSFSFGIVVDLVDPSRQFQANIIFLSSGEQQVNLRYRISGIGTPAVLPSEVTNSNGLVAKTFSALTAGVFNIRTADIRNDLGFSTFTFDEIQTWIIFDASNTDIDFLFDDVKLIVGLSQNQLLKTSSFAHVNTAHPIGIDLFGLNKIPFTISGTEDIIQVDLSPPFFSELAPASGTSQIPENIDLQFHIKDLSSSLDQGTIFVKVDGLEVVSAGSTVTGTIWPIAFKTVLAPNDIEYIFQRGENFPGGTIVTVSGEFADLAAVSNFAEDTYQFQIIGSGGVFATITGDFDLTPPVITPTDPASSAVEISADTKIEWVMTDDAAGVDPSTVKLLLNGSTKLSNDVAVVGSFSRISNTSNGFNYSYIPDVPFNFGTTITGTIFGTDFVGNTTNLIYEFIITASDSLSIENFFLDLNKSTPLTTGTLMSVDIIDTIFGVASGTTSMTINGVTPSGLLTVTSGVSVSGSGPSRLTFNLPLDPLINFREDLVVFVHAENQISGNFPVIKEQQFILRPGYKVNWPNKTDDAEGGPESVFPKITNIQVLTEIKNFAKNFGEGSAFFRFLTRDQQKANLNATIISNIEVADLSANLNVLNPFFEYGKTMTLEIKADDLEGNPFRLIHIFIIEPKP